MIYISHPRERQSNTSVVLRLVSTICPKNKNSIMEPNDEL